MLSPSLQGLSGVFLLAHPTGYIFNPLFSYQLGFFGTANSC
jgi:hypothetical protein